MFRAALKHDSGPFPDHPTSQNILCDNDVLPVDDRLCLPPRGLQFHSGV